MSRSKHTYAQELCNKKAGLALQRSNCLWPGARIGIAVSGGVDSFVLLKVMQIRQSIIPFPIELLAIHLDPGFGGDKASGFANWAARQGIPAHLEATDYGPRAHSPENRKNSPCFYCARLRRKRLFALCAQYGLTHLALGHNADDLQTTFLLNLLRNGQVSGMEISQDFFGGELRVIRPLLLVEKKYIRQAARQWQLPVWQNDCPSAGNTARSEMEELIAVINETLPNARRSLAAALCRYALKETNAPGKVTDT